MALGILATKLFKLPSWVTPAVSFNNTTSLPLLLVQSLGATNILSSLFMSDQDTMSDAVDRARSYLLLNAMVGNSLTFALGPKLLNGQDEDAPEKQEKEDDDEQGNAENGNYHGEEEIDEDAVRANEQTSLLPSRVAGYGTRASQHVHAFLMPRFESSPTPVQNTLSFLYQFANAPLIGAVFGAVVGLAPPLHRAFFNDTESGGILNAWLTSSIKNIGDLFAALQVIVVGVKLSHALRRMKAGEASGKVPWRPMVFVTLVRFVLWPAISISVVWAVAKHTTWLSQDPILWFAMMLMPTGPPAMKLTALADVNGSGDEEKMSIAKFLTVRKDSSPNRVLTEARLLLTDFVHDVAADLLHCRWELEGIRIFD